MLQESTKRKRISILMVEDNAVDAFLTREILSESEHISYEISTVKDGVHALAFLRRTNGYENAARPDIILLDLNLPGIHGFDFLGRIKKEPELKEIPVCILSTSESKSDIEKAKDLNATCYLVKPLDLEEFETIFSGINTGSPD